MVGPALSILGNYKKQQLTEEDLDTFYGGWSGLYCEDFLFCDVSAMG